VLLLVLLVLLVQVLLLVLQVQAVGQVVPQQWQLARLVLRPMFELRLPLERLPPGTLLPGCRWHTAPGTQTVGHLESTEGAAAAAAVVGCHAV
jgi:hypothetical protein